MTTPVPAILGVFAIAGSTVLLTGCADLDDGMRILEGKPTKAQIAAENSPSVSLHLASAVEEEVVVEVEPPAPPPCEPYVWRYMRYSCTGEYLGPVE